jgi:hypothetical protein
MKRILTLFMLLCASTAFTQNAPITFETGANGNTWTWTTFENGSNPPAQVVANPSATGINTSATVLRMTTQTTGQPWAGVESSHGAGIGSFTLNASNAIVKIMVYKPVISDVGIKFATPSGGSTGELKVSNTLINQWEELTFNFSSKIGEVNDQIIIFMDFQQRTSNNICYVDNITFSAAPTDPTVAAPTPTKAANQVISMFSNAYTNVTVDTWRTSWSNATLTDLQIVGNDTKKYSALDFVGIETVTNQINADTMQNFNIDVWTTNVTTLKIKLVDFGANAAFGGGDDKEHELTFSPTLNQWNTYSIPLANFTNLTTRGHIAQLILVGQPTATGTIFIDNVYFSKSAPVATVPTVAAPTPTKAAIDVKSMFSNAYTNVNVDTWRTSWSSATLTDTTIQGNNTKKYSALDFVGIETTGANLINASNMDTFHVDMWTPNITTFRVKLVDFGADAAFGGGDDKEHELLFTPTQNQWNSLRIPLSNFTGLTTKSHIAQLIFSALPTGLGTVYIDNVYFSKKPLVGVNNNENANISIYPNPSTDVLYFTGLNVNETNQVSIFDLQGKLVERYELNENASIDIRNLNKGMYLVKVANHVARIVKM